MQRAFRFHHDEHELWVGGAHDAAPAGAHPVTPGVAMRWVPEWACHPEPRAALHRMASQWLAPGVAMPTEQLVRHVQRAIEQARMRVYRSRVPSLAFEGTVEEPTEAKATTRPKHTLDFVVQYPDATPAKGLEYLLVRPSGKETPGKLGADATIHEDGPEVGTHVLVMKDVERAAWRVTDARSGDEVWLDASVAGLADGTPVKIRIFEEHREKDDQVLSTSSGTVHGGRVEAKVKVEVPSREIFDRGWVAEASLVAEVSAKGCVNWAKTITPLRLAVPRIASIEWKPTEVEVGEEAVLRVAVRAHDGTAVKASLWHRNPWDGDAKIGDLPDGAVTNDAVAFHVSCLGGDDHALEGTTLRGTGEIYARVQLDATPPRVGRSALLTVED